MDPINGTAGADNLNGTNGADEINGLEGNDTLNGLNGNDTLNGGEGDDRLYGQGGADSMTGGAGNDYYGVDNNNDEVVEASADGTDTVISLISYTLTANVENLELSTTTPGNALNATGNGQANRLTGNALANILDGRLGADTLIGGDGNDTYVVDDIGDVITETASQGTDSVLASVSYTLSSEVEKLTLTGADSISGTGNTLDNVLTGNSSSNTLSGDAGNDTLDGGAGNDSMVGGAGDDIYYVDSTTDAISELSGADSGTDKVYSSVEYTLTANVENLTMTGSASIKAVGNASNNILEGNDGNNTLGGAAGADTLKGGAGSDTYYVDNVGDVVEEVLSAAGADSDVVQTSITYILPNYVENLRLVGSDSINGTGNTLDNTLTGNSLANVLYGLDGNDILEGNAGNDSLYGGAGVDTMNGGTGDDWYAVDNVNDKVNEAAGGGDDTVRSAVSYTLSDNVENLVMAPTTNADTLFAVGNSLVNTLTGNTVDNILDGMGGADVLIGEEGNDIYYVDDVGDLIVEVADSGLDSVYVTANNYTLAPNVEYMNLVGAAATIGTGNELDNYLSGTEFDNTLIAGAGNDVLEGLAGNDSMVGGAGNDTYFVDSTADIVSELSGAGSGTDKVYSSVEYTLTANVENLTMTGSASIKAVGNTSNNILEGNDGNNTLGGAAGADTLKGGAGSDTYYVDNVGDIVEEVVSAVGVDLDVVQASITYTLPDYVENLILVGSGINGTGNTLNNTLTGNTLANSLSGGLGDDLLYGGAGSGEGANDTLDGGAGNDTMSGYGGDDTYIVDSTGDSVSEDLNKGTDTVKASITYTLLDNFENLELTGNSTINGTGNSGNNVLTGNSLANILDGGVGTDTMEGGEGNDTYVVDASDSVVESASSGSDLVKASFTYTLGANLEKLTLTGTAAIDGTGNSLANTLIGNSAANVLDGLGGADTLIGGNGGDTYVVDNVADVITENGSVGVDTVRSSVTHTLSANVENLTLIGSGTINGTGNSQANQLTGNSLNNVLYGMDGADTLSGGLGLDTLDGGQGDDTYIYDESQDSIIENAGAGIDNVVLSLSATVARYDLPANFEKLTCAAGIQYPDIRGNSENNYIIGNEQVNSYIYGGAGNDTLDGGSLAVSYSESLYGETGDDNYIIHQSNQKPTESQSVNQGVDTITVESDFAGTQYSAPIYIENIVWKPSVGGLISGNLSDNHLVGNVGNDIFHSGQAGKDTIEGGAGDDKYFIESPDDILIENYNSGIDEVTFEYSQVTGSVAFDWVLGDNFENLTLALQGSCSGTGNSLNNKISGNASPNLIDGMDGNDTISGGGAGAGGVDTLLGGAGDDSITGQGQVDLITGGSGIDTMLGGGGADIFSYGTLSTVSAQTGGTLSTADTIKDFSNDSLKMGTAGTASNYREATAATDFNAANAAASAAMDGTVIYYATSTAADGGLLFIDSNIDGTADALIKLTGITYAGFDYSYIIA